MKKFSPKYALWSCLSYIGGSFPGQLEATAGRPALCVGITQVPAQSSAPFWTVLALLKSQRGDLCQTHYMIWGRELTNGRKQQQQKTTTTTIWFKVMVFCLLVCLFLISIETLWSMECLEVCSLVCKYLGVFLSKFITLTSSWVVLWSETHTV